MEIILKKITWKYKFVVEVNVGIGKFIRSAYKSFNKVGLEKFVVIAEIIIA